VKLDISDETHKKIADFMAAEGFLSDVREFESELMH